jgi:perosamine synthetase
VSFVDEPSFGRSNWWLNAILLDNELAAHRDELLDLTNSSGVMTRPVWTLMHRLPMYENCPRMDLSVAIDLEQRIVNIPSSVSRSPLKKGLTLPS